MVDLEISPAEFLQLVTCLFGGIFTGAGIYVSIVEVPSRRNLPLLSHWEQWRDSFAVAGKMMPIVSLLAGTASAGVYYLDVKSDLRMLWLVQPAVTVFMFLYTIIIMIPEIRILQDNDIVHKKSADWIKEATDRWSRRHIPRAVFQGLAFIIVLYATVRS